MMDTTTNQYWKDLKRGRFDRCSDLHCPDCGTLPDEPPAPPVGPERFVTLTCIDPDCCAEFDVIALADGSWLTRLRMTRVWYDLSKEDEWEESGGVEPPPRG